MLLTVSAIFLVLGILIKYYKMYDLIAGYNTMSKEKQAQYDIEGIATVFRNTMFIMAFIQIAGYVASYWFESKKFEVLVLFVSLAIGLPYLLVLTNSKKYKINKDKDADSSHK